MGYQQYVVHLGEVHPATRSVIRGGLLYPSTIEEGAAVDLPTNPGSGDPAAPDPATWGASPILTESFTSLDTSRWNVRSGVVSNNLARYRSANVTTLSSGGLAITSQLNESDTAHPYWSGDIQTYALSGQPTKWATPGNYWRMQFKARVPLEQGFWAAPLWLRGIRGGGTVDGLEIDLLETYAGHAPDYQITATLHYKPYGAGHAHVTRKRPYADLIDPTPTGYHIYTMEKTPGQVQMWCDELLVGTWTPSNTADFNTYFEVAGTTWAMRSCVQIDATNASVASGTPGASNDWSYDATTMFVPWIKVWDYVA